MHDYRLIPVLLVSGGGLYKTINFEKPRYLGDPINAVRIFNDKEVDEICILDIGIYRGEAPLSLADLEAIVSEAFVPISYGGGISSVDQARRILQVGVEKLCINSAAVARRQLIAELASEFGSSAVVVSIDVRKKRGNYLVVSEGGKRTTKLDLVEWVDEVTALGAGELLINSIDRDGVMSGYDVELLRRVTSRVEVPVVGCGGAGSIEHLLDAIVQGGVTGAAAGSMFVYQGPHRAVLINFPNRSQFNEQLTSRKSL